MSDKSYSTTSVRYSAQLRREEGVWWKKLLDVQLPYRLNLRALHPGFTLDVGCGLGRNLAHLQNHGVGVDHNPNSIEIARQRGFNAFTATEFNESEYCREATFDSLLFSHVVEHLAMDEAVNLITTYLHLLKSNGQVILIAPQEYGFKADKTHVHFFDFAELQKLVDKLDLKRTKQYSFPFPRFLGPFFRYNEFVLVARKA